MSRAPVPRTSSLARSGRLPKPIVRHLDELQVDGLTQAARVQAAAHVTQVSLRLVAALTVEEGLISIQCPRSAARCGLLVDNFTAVAAGLIAELGL